MIKLHRDKVDCPPILDSSQSTLGRNDYKHDEVLDTLLDMQNFKCCYCEKDLSLLGRTAKWVEHFVAKTDNSFKDANGETDWNEANAWENLLYSCSTCNSRKGTSPPFDSNNRRRLIDPSYCRIDPEKHVEFSIDENVISYKERNKSRLGENTIEKLKLKERTDVYSVLRKLRVTIDSIFGDLVNELSVGNTLMANSMLIDLKRMTSAHRPHASFCRKYIRQQVHKVNSNLQTLSQNLGTRIQPITVDVAKEYEVIP